MRVLHVAPSVCKLHVMQDALASLPADQEWFTSGDVARLLGVDRSTVSRWDQSGALHATRILPSGQRRYSRADVAALLTRQASA